MVRIEVDVDGADAVAGRLESATGQAGCTPGVVPDPGAFGANLSDTVATFSERWGWAVDDVHEDVRGAARALRAAISEYQRVDASGPVR
jgi:vacuolar-type H+-ATPase catalytic subunit A/Vma1